MNTQKKIRFPMRDLELLVGGESIERVTRGAWLKLILGFLFPRKSDLTLETWREIERKHGNAKARPASIRDQFSYMNRHI